MKKTNTISNRGFTLIELMVSLTLFIVVMTISMGSIVSIYDNARKARTMRAAMANLNLALESMSKEMRYGKDFDCELNISGLQSCEGHDQVRFTASTGDAIDYMFEDQTLKKRIPASSFIPVTAPEIIIDDMTFYVRGNPANDNLQPKVILIIKGHVGEGKSRTDFGIQTMISQRLPST